MVAVSPPSSYMARNFSSDLYLYKKWALQFLWLSKMLLTGKVLIYISLLLGLTNSKTPVAAIQ